MMAPDLDDIQGRYERARALENDRDESDVVVLTELWLTAQDVPALVAELRAARQQLEEYEHLRSTLVARFGLGSALRPSRVATQVIAAYDQLTGEVG